MNRVENSSTGKLTRATIMIAFFSILAKIAGLLRDRVLAGTFGAGETLDVYYAAFRVPDTVFNLLVLGVLSAAFIQVLATAVREQKERAANLTGSVLTAVTAATGVLAGVLVVFAPILVSLIVPGFSEAQQIETVKLTRIMLLSPIFFGISSVLSSVLNTYRRFALVAAVPIVYNLAIMFGAIVLYPKFGISGLAWGVVLGAFLHMALQVPGVWRLGFRRLAFNLSDPLVRLVGKLYVPRAFGMGGLNQISFVITAIIGSGLTAGSIAIYNLANNLQIVPVSVLAISFATVAFPILSEAFARGDKKSFMEVFNINLSQILFLIIPLSALMLVLRAQIVRLVLGAGAFGWADTIRTIDAFSLLVISLFAQSLIPLLSRAFYALRNTLIPVIAGFVAAGVNIFAALMLVGRMEVAGLAVAFSIAAVVNVVILFVALEFKFGNLVDSELVFKIEKILIATIVASTAAYATLFGVDPFLDTRTALGLLLQGIAAGIVGISVYLILGYIFKIPESRHLMTAGKNWLNKIRSAFIKTPEL